MTGLIGEQSPITAERHILSHFDGDLGFFRGLVLDKGAYVHSQVGQASKCSNPAIAAKARKVTHDYRVIRDLDLEAQEANTCLFAIHKPVARCLRSRTHLLRGRASGRYR